MNDEVGGLVDELSPPTLQTPAVPAAPAAPAAAPARPPAPAPAAVSPAPAAPPVERQTRTRMSSLRHRIAERLLASQQQTATLTTFNEVDLTNLMAMRKRFKEGFEKKHGIKLGVMSFFIKAAVSALQTVPEVNASIDGDDILQNHFYDISVAVSTDRGLVVPVIRDADQKSFAQIERDIADLATRAQQRKLELHDLQGGVFTVSNGGVFGSLLSTPILNPPQSAIRGMHGFKRRPVAIGDQIEIRPMMYLALSYDHRVIDGREAVTFLRRIVDCVEDPERMLLEV
jgi:2-oxoglutarate dehydrogenase E2 component (dihydrolipoamide succinyltransferase)